MKYLEAIKKVILIMACCAVFYFYGAKILTSLMPIQIHIPLYATIKIDNETIISDRITYYRENSFSNTINLTLKHYGMVYADKSNVIISETPLTPSNYKFVPMESDK